MALCSVEDPLIECAGKALLGTQHNDDMPIWALTVARLPIGFRGERLPDRSADRGGIGADTVEPAARLARPGGGAAAHRRDHRSS